MPPYPGAVAFRLLIVTLSFPLTFAHAADDANRLLIRAVSIVSADREKPSAPVDVAVRGDRIEAIGTDLPAQDYAPGEIIDGAGRFLTPGLIDSHVHLTMIPGLHGGHEAAFPEVAAAARRQIPRSYLYHGFTTVIDLIATPEQVAAWNEAEVRPQAYFCGAAPVRDGYPTHRIPRPARYQVAPDFLLDPARPDDLPATVDPTRHTPAAVVARVAERGALGIKTFWEDGFGPASDLPVPSPGLLADLVSAAQAQGLPVLLHANSEQAQRAGVEAGVAAMVHGLWTWDSPDAPELTPPIREILDAIIDRGIGWQPTIQVLYGERDLFDPGYFDRPDVRAVVPAAVIDWYRSPEGQWLAEEMRATPYVARALEEGRWQDIDALPIRHVTQALSHLANHGGHLLFGTDTPSAPTYANPAGLNGRLEMDRWIAAGATPRQILQAATTANATFFKLENEIGRVAVGQRADLLLLADNPLERVTAYDRIERVIVGGRAFDRAALAATADQPSQPWPAPAPEAAERP